MLLYVYIAVSLILDGVLSGFCGLVNSWADIWIVLVLFIGLFLGILILHVIFAVVFSLFIDKGKRPDSLDTFVRRFALCTLDLYLRLIRVKVHASGMEKLPEGRFLLVSNHRTQIDPIIGLVLFRKQKVAFISKKENFKIPFGGRYIAALGCLALDRDDPRAAIKTIGDAADMIKNDVASIGIYPEGGTNRTEETVLPLHSGSFKIAQKAGVPVVVSTIAGTRDVKKKMVIHRSHVYVDIVDVISREETARLRTAELADRAREIMTGNLEKYEK
jgi:1-acyl-sn-glycerol-3-phosphate acyltransferase